MTALPPQRLDAVITPVVDLGLPLVGAFARGQALLLQLLERFQPRWVLASSAGGHTQDSRLLWRRGSTATAGGPWSAAWHRRPGWWIQNPAGAARAASRLKPERKQLSCLPRPAEAPATPFLKPCLPLAPASPCSSRCVAATAVSGRGTATGWAFSLHQRGPRCIAQRRASGAAQGRQHAHVL